MPKTEEGYHNVLFLVILSCLHEQLYNVPPTVNEYIMCVRCYGGSHVLTISRKIVDEKVLSQSA